MSVRRRVCVCAWVGVLSVATASAVRPARAEQPARTGWAAGFGLGGASVSWTWEDGQRRHEESGSGNARVAWALDPDLLLGVEWWGWSRDYEIGSVPEDVPAEITLWSANLAATYFPGNVGFFVRGGLGLAFGSAEVTPPPSVTFPVSGKSDDTGLSVLAAVGYEAGVTSHMAMGGAMHVLYLALDEGPFDNVLGYGLSVQLDWYW